MPRPQEVAEIAVNGQRYSNWDSVSVTRSGLEPFPKFSFTAASPTESSPNWAGLKLGIGDSCEVMLAGRPVVTAGRITGRQPAFDAQQHGLQILGTTNSAATLRATIDRSKAEFKNSSLSQIANALLAPYGVKFSLKGETSGADKPFEKVALQAGEAVFSAIERLCRMRNVYPLTDVAGNYVGYRLASASGAVADLEEGRNILSGSAIFNYTHALSEIEAYGQRPGNDEHSGDASRDVSAKVQNQNVPQHAPYQFLAEMPGDQSDMRMRAQHENGYNIADQIQVNITVQGWFATEGSLWLDHIGDIVSVYSPMLFTSDRMNLAIQEATSSQATSPQGGPGTLSTLTLVLPEAFNGLGQIQGGGALSGLYDGA